MTARTPSQTELAQVSTPQKKIRTRIPAVILLVLLCCNLPSLLFIPLCLKEDFFRPPNTEVLVSACKNSVATGVPGGEVLFVHEVRTGKMYLLDLRTGEKRKVPNDSLLSEKGAFLSSDLFWLEGSSVRPGKPGYRPHYILDLSDGKRYELLDLDTLPRLEGGKFDLKNYAYIQAAQYIYIHHSRNTLIALSSDFRTDPSGRVVFSGFSIGTDFADGLVELIKNFNMDYEHIDLSTTLYSDIPSPTDRYVVRNDGIYLSRTDIPIVTREYTGGRFMGGYFKGWYYNESGVVVQENSSYLFSSTLGPQFFLIPRPILKLQLPATP